MLAARCDRIIEVVDGQVVQTDTHVPAPTAQEGLPR
jgi:hypothetical protein